MYGRPLLREDRPSRLKFNNLLNPPMFESHDHFQAEYLLMYKNEQIADHFSMVRRNTDPVDLLDKEPFMLEGYWEWEGLPARKLSHGKGMMSRQALEKWLFGFFLKICLPFPREKFTDRPVYSPLNLTAFLRLVSHLAEIGYPAHWLAGILSSIYEGTITTSARPPSDEVTHPRDIDGNSEPMQELTVVPWTAQFTTLLSIWSQLMPFGLITSPGNLVSPTDIAEFTVDFPPFIDTYLRTPHFVLVFLSDDVAPGLPSGDLWYFLRHDEGMAGWEVLLLDECVHVFNTIKFASATQTASFWCRTDFMQKIKDEGGWEVAIWRVDTGEKVTKGVKVREGVTMKGLWGQP
jgi:hypothetical protein